MMATKTGLVQSNKWKVNSLEMWTEEGLFRTRLFYFLTNPNVHFTHIEVELRVMSQVQTCGMTGGRQ